MMSELYLDPADDVVTAQKKISSTDAPRITVVIPEGSVLSDSISLRLLRREAAKQGKTIRFKSQDKHIQKLFGSEEEQPATEKSAPGTFVVGRDVAQPETTAQGEAIPEQSVTQRKGVISRLKALLPIRRVPQATSLMSSKKPFLLLGFVIFLAIVGFGLYFLFQKTHHATVRLVVKPESLVKSFEVTASPQIDTVDTANDRIPAQVDEYTESSSETTQTTGSDIIGEKATGMVTIYNKTDEEQEFARGTKLTLGRTEGEDLLYYTDEAVVLPAQTATSSESEVGQETVTYTYGTETVPITAAAIGESYNIGEEETMTVNDLPIGDFMAKNDEAVSGGSKKEVTVVSQEDYDRLTASLTENLTVTLKEKIKSELQGEAVVEDEAIAVSILSQSFDQPLGGVASEVTLTMTMKGVAYSFEKEDLQSLLSDALTGNIPERFQLTDTEQEVSVEGAKVKNGELSFFAKVEGQAIPKLDIDKIKSDLRGKRIEIVQAYIGGLGVVEYFEIELVPQLPESFQVMPSDVSQIEVEVSHTRDEQ